MEALIAFAVLIIVSMVAAATQRARTADNLGNVGSHAGQLGPLHESEIGRRTGARI